MKKIVVVLLLVMMTFALCGCVKANKTEVFGAVNTSDTKAYIHVNGHTIIVDVDQYLVGSNGIINVYGMDGTFYKTHMVNVVMVQDAKKQR